jgi:hypothetical protein
MHDRDAHISFTTFDSCCNIIDDTPLHCFLDGVWFPSLSRCTGNGKKLVLHMVHIVFEA